MADMLTLEEVERAAAQLPREERLELAGRIYQQLNERSGKVKIKSGRTLRPDELAAFLAECDEVACLWQGEFDSAADLRKLREEE